MSFKSFHCFCYFTIFTAFVAVSASGNCYAAPPSQPLTLTLDGKATAVIIIDKNPTVAAQFAALELQDQIKNISGAELPIGETVPDKVVAIYIGESPEVAKLGLGNSTFTAQEYTVKFLPNAVILTGRDEQKREGLNYVPDTPLEWKGLPGIWEECGTLNAVYDFLERFCKVRHFNHTDFGSDYVKSPTLSINGEDVRRKPYFRFRSTTEDYSSANIVNGDYALWKPGSPELESWELNSFSVTRSKYQDKQGFNSAMRNLFLRHMLRMRIGGELCNANHSLYLYYKYFWNASSPDFIEAHPEFFAKGHDGAPLQMCYTNQTLIEQVAKEAEFYFLGKDITGDKPLKSQRWGKDNFTVEGMDNEFQCKCPGCQELLAKDGGAYGSSELLFSFANKIAEKVKKTNPGKTVSTLAYANHIKPPSFELCDNMIVHFCWYSNRYPSFFKVYKEQQQLLEQWTAKQQGRPLYLWLYYTFPRETAMNRNWNCFPAFFAHAVDKQFKLFHKLGVQGIFHCGYGQEVESYVTDRLMDDPTLDVEVLLEDYFRRNFGPASSYMRQFYELVENTYQDSANYLDLQSPQNMEIAWGRLGTAERMEKLQTLMDQASALAVSSPYRERVSQWRDGVWSYMLAGRRQWLEKISQPIPEITAPQVPDASGKPDQVDWSKASPFGPWFKQASGVKAERNMAGKIAHDGKWLYLELSDPCDTKLLRISPAVFSCDDWEIFMGRQRGIPYRQLAVSPAPKTVLLSHGEVNFRYNVSMPDPGVAATSNLDGNCWITRMALPLENMLESPVKPGETVFMNILRVTNGKLTSNKKTQVDSLVSHAALHESVRLASVKLATGAATGFSAISWDGKEDSNVTRLVRLNANDTPERAKSALDRLPAGRKSLLTLLWRGVGAQPGDNALFWDGQGKATAERHEAFFRKLKELGGEVDIVTVDFEGGFSNWDLSKIRKEKPQLFEKVLDDPRTRELLDKAGCKSLVSVLDIRNGDDYLKWNALMEERLAAYLNQAIYEPIRKYYPDVKLSNYNQSHHDPKYPVSRDSHKTWLYGNGAHVGTHQSPVLYGRLTDKNADKTPFYSLICDLNFLRAAKLSSPVPVMPYIAYRGYKGSLLRDSDLYQELVFHAALTGVDTFLYWNPRPWTKKQDPQDWCDAPQDKLLSDLLAQLDEVVGKSPHTTLADALTPRDSSYILTGMRLPDKSVWRFTPRLGDGEKIESKVVDSNPLILRTGTCEIRIPDGQIYKPEKKLSQQGLWIFAPPDVRIKIK